MGGRLIRISFFSNLYTSPIVLFSWLVMIRRGFCLSFIVFRYLLRAISGNPAPVRFSDWEAPIVVVHKSDNISVRLYGDYSTGLNNALECDRHPLPHPDDLFAELAGVCHITHLDLTDAYLQVEVKEDSRKLLTVNEHSPWLVPVPCPGVKSAELSSVLSTALWPAFLV